jgi:ketosteroid isomerase-like protein
MSQENVDLAWSVVGDLGALFDLFDEEIVWDVSGFANPPLREIGGIHYGKSEVIQASRRYVGAWDEYRFGVEEVIDAGERVMLCVHDSGRGKISGVPVEMNYFLVWTFRGGKIVHWAAFDRKADALAAAGLD